MKDLKIYLCTWNLEESSSFVDIFQDLDYLKTKYNLSSETGFLYLDVGFARPSDDFLKELYEEYSDKVIISASAKYTLEKLIPESTPLFEYNSSLEAHSILISFLDLDFKRDEIEKLDNSSVETYPIDSLGYQLSATYEIPQEIYEKSIAEIDLSVRSSNCLRFVGTLTLGDLLNMKEWDGLKIPNLGRKSWNEIKVKLYKFIDTGDLKKK